MQKDTGEYHSPTYRKWLSAFPHLTFLMGAWEW